MDTKSIDITRLSTLTLESLLNDLENTAQGFHDKTTDYCSEYGSGMFYVIDEIKDWMKATGYKEEAEHANT